MLTNTRQDSFFNNGSSAASAVPAAPPPIITYPEFLVQTQPSSITTSTIGNIVTGSTAAMAAIYGLSKHVVVPMTVALSDARHDFLATARTKVEALNDRLGSAVSVVPEFESVVKRQSRETTGGDGADGTDDTGPALFYRDVGVQTSAPLSSMTDGEPKAETEAGTDTKDGAKCTTTDHNDRLRRILDSVAEVSSSATLEADVESQLDRAVDSIRGRFFELAHTRPMFHSYPYMHGAYAHRADAEANDPFWHLKEDIRGLKGSLLSPRSFTARRMANLRGQQSALGQA